MKQQKSQMFKSFQASTIDTKARFRVKEFDIDVLDQKGVENWINEILNSSDYQSLQGLGLDRKTLTQTGLLGDEISRIYRCLFIYSFGFYQMLQEITKNYQVTTQLWKVFSVLLQQTSKQEFQFTLNVIQEEHKQVVSQLNDSLLKKDSFIQQLEQQQQENLDQLNDDIRMLREQYSILYNQKQNIEGEFKQINNAYEEQATLSSQFECKVNEIYAQYKDIQIRYKNLLEDYKNLNQQYNQISGDIQVLRQDNESVYNNKFMLEAERNEQKVLIEELQAKLVEQNVIVNEYNIFKQRLAECQISEFSQIKEKEYQLKSLKQMVEELENQIIQNNEIIQQNKQSIKQQNDKIINLNEVIDNKSELLIKSQQQNDWNTSEKEKYKNLSERLQQDLQQIQSQNQELTIENKRLIAQNQQFEIDLTFLAQKTEILQSEVNIQNKNMKLMKQTKLILEEDFVKEKAKVEQLTIQLQNKEDQLQDIEKCYNYSQQRLHTLSIEMAELESKSKIQQSELQMKEDLMSKKIEFLEQNGETNKTELINERYKYEALINSFENVKNELTELRNQYKTTVFENNSLKTKQSFFENVIENERARNLELLNEATSLKLQYENLQREHKSLSQRSIEQYEQIVKEKQFITKRYENKLKDFKMQMKEMDYKMYYEDLLSACSRLHDTLNLVRIDNSKLNKNNIFLTNQANQSKAELEGYRQQLQMQKQITRHLELKVNQAEENQNKIKKLFFLKVKEIEKYQMELQENITFRNERDKQILFYKQQLEEMKQQQQYFQQQEQKSGILLQKTRYMKDNNNLELQDNIQNGSPNDEATQRKLDPPKFKGRSKTKRPSQIAQLEQIINKSNQIDEQETKCNSKGDRNGKRLSLGNNISLDCQIRKEETINISQLPQVQHPHYGLNSKIMLDSIRIKEDLLNMSNEFQTVPLKNSAIQISEEQSGVSRSVSSRKSYESQKNDSSSIQPIIEPRQKRPQVKVRDNKQFARLYQFANQYYNQK